MAEDMEVRGNEITPNVMTRNVIAVTNRRLCRLPFLEQIERVCRQKPKALLLREKDLTPEDYRTLAEEVLSVCGEYRVPCILHTFFKTARALGRTEIHLPLSILLTMTEEETAFFRTIGCSVHSVEEAVQAEERGASYLTAGHIYATDCKWGAPPKGLPYLSEICQNVSIPVYAIGGIRLEKKQIEEVTGSGAAGVCIMSEMMKL